MTVSARFLDSSSIPLAPPEEAAWDALHAAAAARGDSLAFQRLVNRHSPALHRFCLHCLGNLQDAEDVTQESFVRAWHALPRYRESGTFRPWLWRIALNRCRDLARSRSSRLRWLCNWSSDSPPDAISPSPSPDETAAHRADLDRLSRGLALLPENLREPLLLSAIENLPHHEIAAILNTTTRAIDNRVQRARHRLNSWWSLQP